jgi:hypothetical protein
MSWIVDRFTVEHRVGHLTGIDQPLDNKPSI